MGKCLVYLYQRYSGSAGFVRCLGLGFNWHESSRFLFADTPGLFAYDEIIDEWYHVGTRLQEIQSIADQAMKTINENL